MVKKLVILRNVFLSLTFFFLLLLFTCATLHKSTFSSILLAVSIICFILFLVLTRVYSKKVRIAKEEQLRQKVREDSKK